MSATCRSCDAPIVWAYTTPPRKAIPLDGEDQGGWTSPVKVENGNLRATGERVPNGDGTTAMVVEVVPRPREGRFYRTHFATCPDAKSWRRGPS